MDIDMTELSSLKLQKLENRLKEAEKARDEKI